jgi:hypothetical protein
VRQNLLERSAVIAINELDGEVSARAGFNHLKSKGLVPSDEDFIEEGQLEWIRGIFQKSGRYTNTEGTGKFEWAHITVRLDDGSKKEYYKKVRQTTIEEAIQDLEYWHKYTKSGIRKLRKRYDQYCKIHGKRKIQRRLTFDIPAEEPIKT